MRNQAMQPSRARPKRDGLIGDRIEGVRGYFQIDSVNARQFLLH